MIMIMLITVIIIILCERGLPPRRRAVRAGAALQTSRSLRDGVGCRMCGRSRP